ncbi:DUF2254 domain-containing protein [Pontixanthobacter gangjinensis]|uniref:DUF2254 domain-containing protein n=1 Tax=Pontixanthobacter gangjinensis TaxID=1028742 RepID=A0A6I4SQ98_9SPHN|nr:DUF2254 domain-containing protein [Pontixanthobacter gangjinensis]MXO57819.1 DUF2254 domain-containing protein [Pontixanthobacter gangjinensis]
MLTRLRAAAHSINASYWFFPALFAILALLLASLTIQLDRSGWADWLGEIVWLHPARPDGASNMLTVIAGSMIGVASTVFSITIAAVAYASGTYGPRLLTNFMEDRGNQLSLATFIGTFVYSLTVLRTVRTSEEQNLLSTAGGIGDMSGFVPQLSLLVAYGLMALSIAVLVYFLNHIPASIRINTVLQEIGERLIHDIGTIFPDPADGGVEMKAPQGTPVNSQDTGYIQVIDFEGLDALARGHDAVMKLAVRTGDFIHRDLPLVYWAGDKPPKDIDGEVRDCFALGGMRTPNQDLHFLIDELVEIGLRALSPGINDPFTAVTSVHWLGAATAQLGQRKLVRSFGEARNPNEDCLVLLNDDFAHYIQRGFGGLRSAMAASPIAAIVGFDAMAKAATTLEDASRRADLANEVDQLMRQARECLTGPDLEQVEASYQELKAKRN